MDNSTTNQDPEKKAWKTGLKKKSEKQRDIVGEHFVPYPFGYFAEKSVFDL